jgi:hypothetical protein
LGGQTGACNALAGAICCAELVLALPLMDTTRYVLCRIEDDTSLTPISEPEDISAGVAAGKHRGEVEHLGYGLYADGVRVASFAEGHVGCRKWVRRNGRLGDIHSLDDRLDHDIDELIA